MHLHSKSIFNTFNIKRILENIESFISGDPGGMHNRLSALGAWRRSTLSRYDVHPVAQRRALQMKKHLAEAKR